MAPKEALLPAREKGDDATLVPKTLDCGAPKAAKSVTTLRVGEEGLPEVVGAVVGGVTGRRGNAGADDIYPKDV